MYIIEMMESSLIDFSYTHPWADELIRQMEVPPAWLCDFAARKNRDDLIKAVREYAFSEPFVAVPVDLEMFHVACLFLRYERRELSWATFLRLAGDRIDAAGGDCETPYHYLNVYEDACFSEAAELETKTQYVQDHELDPWIDRVREMFEPFQSLCRLKKTR